MILFVATISSFMDLKKAYTGKARHILNIYSLGFCFLIAVIATILYIILCESGTVKYDSFVAAFLIAISPMSLLRSSLFDTPTGKQIGFSIFYGIIRGAVNDRIRTARFSDYQKYVNCIAYYNNLEELRIRIMRVYSDGKDEKISDKRLEEIKNRINTGGTVLEMRRNCAELLLDKFDWNQLVNMGLVQKEYVDLRSRGPEDLINACKQRIDSSDDLRSKLNDLYQDEMEYIKQNYRNRYDRIHEEIANKELSVVEKLRILVSECHLAPSFFENNDYLERGWFERNKDRHFLWNKVLRFLGITRRI